MTSDSQPHANFQPADVMTIDDLDTLKVLTDPLRLRLRELMSQPCTVKEMSKHLGVPATKLYYHINLLEKRHLIVVVNTRIVSGIIEKHYQVAAKKVQVSRQLLSSKSETSDSGLEMTVMSLFDDIRTDLSESVERGIVRLEEDAPYHHTLSMGSTRYYLTEEQAQDLYARMKTIYEELQSLSEAQADQENVTLYKFLHVLFPSSRQHRHDED